MSPLLFWIIQYHNVPLWRFNDWKFLELPLTRGGLNPTITPPHTLWVSRTRTPVCIQVASNLFWHYQNLCKDFHKKRTLQSTRSCTCTSKNDSTIEIHSLSVPNPNRFQQVIRWHPPVLLWNLLEGICPEQCWQRISHSQTWSGICSILYREVFEFKIGAGL